jgi:serine/threonine protein kinase
MAMVFANRWEVIDSLGEGGQGWVYRVRDTQTAKDDAFVLKRLKNHSRLARFKREISAAIRLQHEGICQVVDFSLEDPAFVVMPFVSGKRLAEMGQIRPLEALQLFSALCDIVHYAHQASVVHRDLKPDNILVRDDSQVVVLDFGLCYFTDEEERLTETMEQVGSRFYMAPELESGRSTTVTAKADVYSLGKILYFLLSGKHLARENLGGENDLVRINSDSQLEYVNRKLLGPALAEAPQNRPDAAELRKAAENVARLITEHYYPGIERSQCRFCGDGHYRRLGHHTSVNVFENSNVYSDQEFVLIKCDSCGNVQWFAVRQ